MNKLNLGCGDKKRAGYINIDICELLNPDIVHNLDVMPWPVDDDSCSEIIAEDVYEHVLDPIGFMQECWRIMKKGGGLYIRTSCFNTPQSYTDPTHRRFLTLGSFDYWDPKTEFGKKYWWYAKGKFQIMKKAVDGQELIFKLVKL